MPLATYTIKKSFFENHKEIDLIKLSEFNTDIEDFNLNQKAILIENANDNIKNKLGNIINELASNKLDNTLIQKKILLSNFYQQYPYLQKEYKVFFHLQLHLLVILRALFAIFFSQVHKLFDLILNINFDQR